MAPSRRDRALVAVVLGLSIGALVTLGWQPMFGARRLGDFYQLWIAARAWITGQSPYEAVATSRWLYPLYYPMPAVVLALPIAELSLTLARGVFVGASSAAFAYAVTKRGWWMLSLCGSGVFLAALLATQFGPLFVASAFGPVWLLGLLCAVKPTMGVMLWCYRPSWRAAVIGILCMLLSVALYPVWPWEWLAAVRNARDLHAPIFRPGGIVLAAAVLRWRRPEARLLIAMACIPHTIALHEALPLILALRSRREALVATIWTLAVAYIAIIALAPMRPLGHYLDRVWVVMLFGIYIPVLALILRRPNVREWPSWTPWYRPTPQSRPWLAVA